MTAAGSVGATLPATGVFEQVVGLEDARDLRRRRCSVKRPHMPGESSPSGLPHADPPRGARVGLLLYSRARDRAPAVRPQRHARAGRFADTRDGPRRPRPCGAADDLGGLHRCRPAVPAVVGFDDVAVTGAALVGLGEALHRLDDDWQAVATWEEATPPARRPRDLPAWRNVAAARVRAGNLQGAIDAFREAEKRAPELDKAEIASRLGWLSRRPATRGPRGGTSPCPRGAGSRSRWWPGGHRRRVADLRLRRPGGHRAVRPPDAQQPLVAVGELWRLWTVALVHSPLTQMPLHLVFDMYFLYLAGPFVGGYGR